jgi:SHS2 domain-containing protein
MALNPDLDHTADVQCHCWGKDLPEAFANMAPCIFNYMTDLSTVVINPEKNLEFTVAGERCILISWRQIHL